LPIRGVKILIIIQLLAVTTVILGAMLFVRAPTPSRGVVKGILYSDESPAVIIDGQLLQQGDTIYGVRIARVYRDKVQFEKNGKRWQQRLGQRPDEAWNEQTNEDY